MFQGEVEANRCCGVCRSSFVDAAPSIRHCTACEAPHHPECWEFGAGCSTYGCPESAVLKAQRRSWNVVHTWRAAHLPELGDRALEVLVSSVFVFILALAVAMVGTYLPDGMRNLILFLFCTLVLIAYPLYLVAISLALVGLVRDRRKARSAFVVATGVAILCQYFA